MNADKVSASQAQHDALDVQTRVAEVEQQADMQARCPKVVDALGAMDLSNRLDRLQLDDHRFLDQQKSSAKSIADNQGTADYPLRQMVQRIPPLEAA